MAQTDSGSHVLHRQKWDEMKVSLENFCTLLDGSMTDFNQKFKQNWEMGFPSENAYYYQQAFLLGVEQEIDQLIQIIQKDHFKFIDEKIVKIKKVEDLT